MNPTTPDPAADAMPEPVPVPAPAAEYLPAPASEPAADAGPPRAARPRRKARAVLRWTAALLVFAAVGGASAWAVTLPERTRLPGLHTPGDGRWTYPPLALPKLPAGRPRPLADANAAGRHYADVRSLLLPAPLTAKADPALPGGTGWLPAGRFVGGVYGQMSPSRIATEEAVLRENGLRHIAARAWTMPDGTRTEVYLLQFTSSAYSALYRSDVEAYTVKGVGDTAPDKSVASRTAVPSAIDVEASAEKPPYGPTAARYAWLYSGDTIALVLQTRAGSVAEVPFRQTVRLQAQLLG